MDGTGEAAGAEDWGPFGRPLFDDPSARALGRVGVVDVGSNSVRLVVFDGAARSPAYFFNEKVMAGLGETRFLYILRDPVERLWSHVRMIARRRFPDRDDIAKKTGRIT